ncbi:hypothetical protein KY289_026427 [Solanum tuberosum]|nr:hypothetical protein KY289_026427 [Solanum tuberosum]
MEEKINITALQLEGEAVRWHLSFMKYRQYIQPPCWNEYVVALVERFGADSLKKLVSFEFSNLPTRNFYQEDIIYFQDKENDIETFENMHLGWFFLNDNSHVDTKSLDGDWKEVLSWQSHFDTIVSNVLTSCDLWLNMESNKKTCHNEEIENRSF